MNRLFYDSIGAGPSGAGGGEIPEALLQEILNAYTGLPTQEAMGMGYKGWKGGYLAAYRRYLSPSPGLRWISIKDKLPEWGHCMLLWAEFMSHGKPASEMFVGYLGENGECFRGDDDDYGWTFEECIEYWMPLPGEPNSSPSLPGEQVDINQAAREIAEEYETAVKYGCVLPFKEWFDKKRKLSTEKGGQVEGKISGIVMEFIDDHKKWELFELTDEQEGKLKGTPKPGGSIVIIWQGTGSEEIVDYGYLFLAPFCDEGVDDFFIHVPEPENPGGKDTAHPEWKHLNELLTNQNVKEIRCGELFRPPSAEKGEQVEEKGKVVEDWNHKQPFEKFEKLTEFIREMAMSGQMPIGTAWSAFLYELNKVCAAASGASVEADQRVPEEIVQWIAEQLDKHGILAGSNIFKEGAIAMYHKMQDEVDNLQSEIIGYKQAARMTNEEIATIRSSGQSAEQQWKRELQDVKAEALEYRKAIKQICADSNGRLAKDARSKMYDTAHAALNKFTNNTKDSNHE